MSAFSVNRFKSVLSFSATTRLWVIGKQWVIIISPCSLGVSGFTKENLL